MPDTLRDLAALQTLLADNTIGDISPQDVRDFLYSMKRPHGSIYITSSAETSIALVSTPVKVAGTTALSDNTSHYLFDMPASNRLRYTGSPDCHAHIAISLSMTAAANNKVAELSVYKNGTTRLEHSVIERKITTGSDVGATALHADCNMSQNDYIELWIANNTDSANMTISKMYMFALGMFM